MRSVSESLSISDRHTAYARLGARLGPPLDGLETPALVNRRRTLPGACTAQAARGTAVVQSVSLPALTP
jgi:hypothetical protein